MRKTILVKLAVLTLLGVGSHLVTKEVIKVYGQSGGASIPVGSITTTQGFKPALAGGNNILAGGSMQSLEVHAIGNRVAITASASIFDKRPNTGFVWSVRVLDPSNSNKIIYEKRYDEQVFQAIDAGEINPTFDDELAIPLQPGTYNIDVVIYRFFPNRGLNELSDRRVAEQRVGPRGRRAITIRPQASAGAIFNP